MHTKKLDNLQLMDKLLERHKLTKIGSKKKKTGKLDRPIINKEIELVI